MPKEYSICPIADDPCKGPACPLLICGPGDLYFCGLNPALPGDCYPMPIITPKIKEDKKQEKD